MFEFFKNIISSSIQLPIGKNQLEKYNQDFFVDKNIQNEIKQKGFAVRKLLGSEQIDLLKNDFSEILERDDNEITDLFWNSGRAQSIIVRNMAKSTIQKNVQPYLEQFFLPDKADWMGGVFVIKPPTKRSELNPHQDSSHVEENQFMSVYAWCTLTDVTVENGALHVVPGSHRFGNTQRSLNVPWQFTPYTDILWKYAQPVEMKAGDVLFFDSASIHCSTINKSQDYRLAVNFFVKQKEADFLHYYVGEETEKNQVEKFIVDMDFYYDKDFEKRPGQEYLKKGEEKLINLQLNAKKMIKLCELGKDYISSTN